MDWLPAHLPDADATAIAHGDFRLDNLMWHPTEPRELRSVGIGRSLYRRL